MASSSLRRNNLGRRFFFVFFFFFFFSRFAFLMVLTSNHIVPLPLKWLISLSSWLLKGCHSSKSGTPERTSHNGTSLHNCSCHLAWAFKKKTSRPSAPWLNLTSYGPESSVHHHFGCLVLLYGFFLLDSEPKNVFGMQSSAKTVCFNHPSSLKLAAVPPFFRHGPPLHPIGWSSLNRSICSAPLYLPSLASGSFELTIKTLIERQSRQKSTFKKASKRSNLFWTWHASPSLSHLLAPLFSLAYCLTHL